VDKKPPQISLSPCWSGGYSKQGWEFYRVDTIGMIEKPGCLAALFGARAGNFDYYVVTFRRGA